MDSGLMYEDINVMDNTLCVHNELYLYFKINFS